MSLKRVSFAKGREYAPRLSEPRVPGRHSGRYWTEAEIAIVAEHYARRGAAYCLSLLPGRSLTGVYQQAKKAGLMAPRVERRRRIGDTLDEEIRAAWPLLKGRGAVAALADRLGVRPDVVSRRALHLGLSIPHKKEPRWTEAEDALLAKAPVNDPKRAAEFFAAHGFHRTPASIMNRCKRMGLSRRRTDVLSGYRAARILGVDSKTLTSWVIDGDIAAERRGTERLPQQGGDAWAIRPADLRRFVLDNLDRLDLRKVDRFEFVTLMAEIPAPIADLVRALEAAVAAEGEIRVEIAESAILDAADALREPA